MNPIQQKIGWFLLLTWALASAALVGAAEADSSNTTIEEIRVQVTRSSDVGAFVRWLKQRTNVSDVEMGPIILTTHPSQQWVDFSIDGKRYRFRLMKELDTEIVSVRGTDRTVTVVKGKVVIIGEEQAPAKK